MKLKRLKLSRFAWITERHGEEPSIRTAWKEIEEAVETSPYYASAWGNFTRAGCHINRAEIDTLHNVTGGWTKNVESYVVAGALPVCMLTIMP